MDLVTIALDFSELNPLVAEALHSFEPEIDFKRLIVALRSEAGRHRSTYESASLKINSERVNLEERKLLAALASGPISARFFWWHESLKNSKSTVAPIIPKRFHEWLRKFVNRQNEIIPAPAASPSTPKANKHNKSNAKQTKKKSAAAIEAARIGFDGKEQAFRKYYRTLKGLRVICPKCKSKIKALGISLHILKSHGIDEIDFHRRLHFALKQAVGSAKKKAVQREYFERLAERERDVQYLKSGKLYPSAWKLVLKQKHDGSYVRQIPAGAVETNRRRH
jgi:hypothetical protein